jgi:hypothetical protein
VRRHPTGIAQLPKTGQPDFWSPSRDSDQLSGAGSAHIFSEYPVTRPELRMGRADSAINSKRLLVADARPIATPLTTWVPASAITPRSWRKRVGLAGEWQPARQCRRHPSHTLGSSGSLSAVAWFCPSLAPWTAPAPASLPRSPVERMASPACRDEYKYSQIPSDRIKLKNAEIAPKTGNGQSPTSLGRTARTILSCRI